MSDTTPDPLEPDADAYDSADAPDALAASAVVDGTATDAERVHVAGSTTAADLLGQFSADRAALTAEVTIDPAARASALAAAMSVFDELHRSAPDAAAAITGSVPVTAKVLTFERRKRQYRLVAGLAAAVVGVLGVAAIATNMSGSDSELSSSAAEATIAASGKVAADPAASPLAATADTESPSAASDQMTAAEAAPAASQAPAMTEAAADTESPAETEAPADTEAPAATEAPASGGAEPMAAVDTPEALRAWASTRLAPAEVDTTCVVQGAELLGQVTSLGADAIVVRDPATGVISSLDALTCAVLVTSP